MRRLPRSLRSLLAASTLGLLLAGCTAPSAQLPVATGFDLIGNLPAAGGVRVSMDKAGRWTQTLPGTWASASFTLSGSNLVASRVQTLDAASFSIGVSAQTSIPLFAGTRPGTYALYASTYTGASRNAMGYLSTLTLAANTTTAASITLRTLPVWTADTLVNAAGTSGDGGAGGAATTTPITGPRGLCLDATGSLYFSEYGYNRIRKVATPYASGSATMSTLIGDAATLSGPSALVYAPNTAGLYVADSGNNRVRYVSGLSSSPTFGSTVNFASNAYSLTGSPQALAYYHNAGTGTDYLYVALSTNKIVEVSDPQGAQAMRLITGTGLTSPKGLAINSAGTTLYVSDAGNHQVYAYDLSTLNRTTVAGNGSNANTGDGGTATSASLQAPADLAYEALGDQHLYVLDTAAATVRCITLDNGMIASVFGNGVAAYAGDGQAAQKASLMAPAGMGVFVNSASLSVFVSDANRIRSVR